MIVCHHHRFIFVTTRKTAGARVQRALADNCAAGDLITGSERADEAARAYATLDESALGAKRPEQFKARDWLRHVLRGRQARLPKHMTAAEIRDAIGPAAWDSYFKFCVERNPWEKAVALYEQRTRGMTTRPPILEFLANARAESLSNYHLYTIDATLAVDRVIRYEHLAAELQAVSHLLNLSKPVVLAPETHTEHRPHYSALLGPAERAIVDAVCTREIETFGYGFAAVAPADR